MVYRRSTSSDSAASEGGPANPHDRCNRYKSVPILEKVELLFKDVCQLFVVVNIFMNLKSNNIYHAE